MDKRTTAIIATVITGLLCGCPGLAILCYGAFAVPTSFVPGAQIDVFGNNDPQSLLTSGIVGLCLGILLIAIPVVVGFTTLRNRPAAAGMVVPPAPPRPVKPVTQQPSTDFTPPPAPPETPPTEPAEPESLVDAWARPQEEAPAEEPSEPPTAEASDWQAPTVIGEQPTADQPPETQQEAAPEAPPETPPESSPAEPPKPDEDDDAIPPAI
jgi:hypothetical protein